MKNVLDASRRSFGNAIRGVRTVVHGERNFRIELGVAVGVTVAAFAFPLTAGERGTVLITIAFVLVLEIVNTALERVIDLLRPGLHPYAKRAKDLAAGAVLVASLGAAAVGAVIFIPHILSLVLP